MGQVTITLNGRSYRLRCGDGEEARLLELADYVAGRLSSLAAEFGRVGDERLLVMTALLIADELFDARGAPVGAEWEARTRLARSPEPFVDQLSTAMPSSPDALGPLQLPLQAPRARAPVLCDHSTEETPLESDPPLKRAIHREARSNMSERLAEARDGGSSGRASDRKVGGTRE